MPVEIAGRDGLGQHPPDRLERGGRGGRGAARRGSGRPRAPSAPGPARRRASSSPGAAAPSANRPASPSTGRVGRGIASELARIDVDADQRAGERDRSLAMILEVGLAELGAERQHHVGLADQGADRRQRSRQPPASRGWPAGRMPLALAVRRAGAPSLSISAAHRDGAAHRAAAGDHQRSAGAVRPAAAAWQRSASPSGSGGAGGARGGPDGRLERLGQEGRSGSRSAPDRAATWRGTAKASSSAGTSWAAVRTVKRQAGDLAADRPTGRAIRAAGPRRAPAWRAG